MGFWIYFSEVLNNATLYFCDIRGPPRPTVKNLCFKTNINQNTPPYYQERLWELFCLGENTPPEKYKTFCFFKVESLDS